MILFKINYIKTLKSFIIISLLNDKKNSKFLVLGPGARRTFRFLTRTPRILFLTSCPGRFIDIYKEVIVFNKTL